VGARGGKCKCKALASGFCKRHDPDAPESVSKKSKKKVDISKFSREDLDSLRAEIQKREFVLAMEELETETPMFEAELQEIDKRKGKKSGAVRLVFVWEKQGEEVVVKSKRDGDEVSLGISYLDDIWEGAKADDDLTGMLAKLGFGAEYPLEDVLTRIGVPGFVTDHEDFKHE
jgi:hypothetical protein